MEADWAVEIGANLPEIVVPWEGFVDLAGTPDRVAEIAEVKGRPALGDALILLNAESSPVFTSKCDVWLLDRDEIDPLEFGAEDAGAGIACYIDLLPRNSRVFASFSDSEARARHLTSILRDSSVLRGRVDLVIRAALVEGQSGFGMTLYAAGCGKDEAEAASSWEAVLRASAAATISVASAGE